MVRLQLREYMNFLGGKAGSTTRWHDIDQVRFAAAVEMFDKQNPAISTPTNRFMNSSMAQLKAPDLM